MPTLPFDIIYLIVEFYAFLPNGRGRKALSALSRTCRSLLPICRQHIFSTVSLRPRICDWSHYKPSRPDNDYEVPSIALQKMEDLLESNAGIADYVRTLYYHSHESNHEGPGVVQLLSKFNHIQKLVIMPFVDIMDYGDPDSEEDADDPYVGDESDPPLNWKKLPLTLQEALERLIHLPTLVALKFTKITGFPTYILLSCTSLRTLDISHSRILPISLTAHSPMDFTPIKLRDVALYPGAKSNAQILRSRRPDGLPVFDFSGIQRLNITLDKGNDVQQFRELMGGLQQLETLRITCGAWHAEALSLALAEEASSLERLRSLSLATLTYQETHLFQRLFPFQALKHSPSLKLLENIDLSLEVHSYYEQAAAHDLEQLDQFLSTPAMFPALKSVTVNVGLLDSWSLEEKEKWETLPRTHLIRLSNDGALDFSYSFWYDADVRL
ncbi:hypothetical protein BDZ97DRAFT_1920203 [Flammula alnicola]|nr:hypothetical protein BDZ97DRAFT_1920203 [Flammula alnicola]